MPPVSEVVGRVLAELGISRVFGVVGSGNFDLTNALRANGVGYIAARHECGATTMADAYARMTDTVAAVTLHQGCGLTNALTGITEAAKSLTPLVILAADTAGEAVLSNFRVDQDALATAVGAVAERIHNPHSAIADTIRAFRTARDQRRCVVLNLPLDIQAAEIAVPASFASAGLGTAALGPFDAPGPPDAVRPTAAAVMKLLGLLSESSRPVFIAGRGARAYGPELRALGESSGALLATSAVAHGLFQGDPWSLGISGGFASPLVAELITEAALIVGWGCALNMWTMRHGILIGPNTTVVQVDSDAAALGAHRPIDVGVHGDVGEAARDALVAATPRAGYRTPRVASRLAALGRWRDVPFTDRSTGDRIDPRTLSIALDDLLPTERIVAVDSGNFMGYPSAYLEVPDQYGFCFTQAFQSIGLGLATAIGCALARPDRLPVAALGDGGALMGISELETVVCLGIPMLIVIYDDHAYGAEVHHFRDADLGAVTFPDTDIAAHARGAGCAAAVIRTVTDLDIVAKWLAGHRNTPLLLDAKIISDGGSWWLQEAFARH
ncbi:thiamine pyrophosphate-binding protein [Nocardia seriolae]|uniref:acetolactate synthase n=1 Tax=Nocardia seriolae TaxID=37332 RepID=A0ABC9YVU2_9NOCA|nr:thiamine pyrophosphate-binding protein [Nocardia seriolae]BEK98216.1 thiamine pyrophosphate-binding protein [Nocardia seriolae]GAM47682.1 acetolactate synthase [Nocardia seriolae]GAP29520.1 acetolactate synthase [Nocardia seriolae]